jgi:hypothetical protein
MNDGVGYDRRRAQLLWGVALGGISSFHSSSCSPMWASGYFSRKATGLAAVAVGLTEAYVTFGFILTLVLPVASIVLLARSLSGADRMRKVLSSLLIVCSSFILLLWGLCGWFFLVQMPRLVSGH